MVIACGIEDQRGGLGLSDGVGGTCGHHVLAGLGQMLEGPGPECKAAEVFAELCEHVV